MSFSSDSSSLANQLSLDIVFADDENTFKDILTILCKDIANAVNSKEGALYLPEERFNFQRYFTPGNPQVFRNVYRTVVNFGALPNAGTKSVAHNISFDANFSATRIFATATDPVNLLYIPIPFSSPTLNENIKITVDATNVNITTAINYSTYTTVYVVIEYVKNN